MPIYYDGQEIGQRRVDFFVEGKVMVEIKALSALCAISVIRGADKGFIINW